MGQNLTANSIRQMPQVTSPDLLRIKIIDNLIANCLNQTANPFAKPQLLLTQLRRLSILGRNRKLKSLMLKKLHLKGLRKISSISQKQSPRDALWVESRSIGRFAFLYTAPRSAPKAMPETKVLDDTEIELIAFRYSITSYDADYRVDYTPTQSQDKNHRLLRWIHHRMLKQLAGDFRLELGTVVTSFVLHKFVC